MSESQEIPKSCDQIVRPPNVHSTDIRCKKELHSKPRVIPDSCNKVNPKNSDISSRISSLTSEYQEKVSEELTSAYSTTPIHYLNGNSISPKT